MWKRSGSYIYYIIGYMEKIWKSEEGVPYGFMDMEDIWKRYVEKKRGLHI